MAAIHHPLREIHSISPGTREWIVTAATCPPLQEHGIRIVGRSATTPGFAFARRRPDMAQLLACTAGRGEALIDGAWQPLRAGHAYLTPARAPHAYRAASRRWDLAWVIFRDSPATPLASLDAPCIERLDAQPLNAAIRELYRESIGPADLAVMRQWVDLVHTHARRAAAPGDDGSRLVAVWEAVDADLARPWTLDDLATLASVSAEHLRRLCHTRHGMSPMRRVAEMRLRRAAGLLVSTPWSIERVATAVGYANAFAFSTAFKRRYSVTPSAYRRVGSQRSAARRG